MEESGPKKILNFSNLKFSIKSSLYHTNPLASQVEAIANFHGFKDGAYPDLGGALRNIATVVKFSNSPQIVAHKKLVQEDMDSQKGKGDAVVKSGVPTWLLQKYGENKGICFVLFERVERRSKFQITDVLGHKGFFEKSGNELDLPKLCPLVITQPSAPKFLGPIYELLEVTEKSQASFIDLFVRALDVKEDKAVGMADGFVRVSADEYFQKMMPAVEEATADSLLTNRKAWFPVK